MKTALWMTVCAILCVTICGCHRTIVVPDRMMTHVVAKPSKIYVVVPNGDSDVLGVIEAQPGEIVKVTTREALND